MRRGLRAVWATAPFSVTSWPSAQRKSKHSNSVPNLVVSLLTLLVVIVCRPLKLLVQQTVTEYKAFQQDAHCILTYAVSDCVLSLVIQVTAN